MRTVAIALDGVLRKPLDVEAQDFGASLLYASLTELFRVVILGGYEIEKDRHFLGVNGLTKYARIEPLRREDGPTVLAQERARIRRLRAEGFAFEFVIIPDPELATDLFADGVSLLLYMHPTYGVKKYRPTEALRPWDELVAEVEFQRQVMAEQREGS